MRFWATLASASVILATACSGESASQAAAEAASADEASSNANRSVTMPEGPPEVSGDIVETPSGLRYIVIDEGDGRMPEPGERVRVHYTGWLTTGHQFDSSVDGGQPFVFNVGRGSVIRGWDEGVAMMKVGGKRRLIVPPELGYGESGRGPIPPGATLVFDVELLGIEQ